MSVQHTLCRIFHIEPGIRDAILSDLSATESSMICALIKYDLYLENGIRFLNPIRDLLQYEKWINQAAREGYTITLIGKDLIYLLQRIADPLLFFELHLTQRVLDIWILILKLGSTTGYSTTLKKDTKRVSSKPLPLSSLPESSLENPWTIEDTLYRTNIRIVSYGVESSERNPMHVNLDIDMDSIYFDRCGYLASGVFFPLISKKNSNAKSTRYVNIHTNPYKLHLADESFDTNTLDYTNSIYVCLKFKYINDGSNIDQEEICIDMMR